MTSDSDPKLLPDGEKHLIEAHTRPEPQTELMTTGEPYEVAAGSEPIFYQEELAEQFGYEFDAVALAELELASDFSGSEKWKEMVVRLVVCQDPENPAAYGLLEIGSDNTVVGEYALPRAEAGAPVEVTLGRSDDEEKVDQEAREALPGLNKNSVSREHVKITITEAGLSFENLSGSQRTSITRNPEVASDGLDDDTVPRAVIEKALQEIGDLGDDPAVSREAYLAASTEENVEEPEEIEAEPQLESDPEAILRDHFDALLDGNTEIEGVDPEVAHMVRGELRQLVNMWRELSTEDELSQISGHISEIIQGLIAEGTPIAEATTKTRELMNVLGDFTTAAVQLRNAIYEGDMGYIEHQTRQFRVARETLEQHFGEQYFETLEDVRTGMFRMYEAVEEEITTSRQKKAELEATQPNEEERAHLKQLGSVSAIRGAISEIRPGVNKLRQQRDVHEELLQIGGRVANGHDVRTRYAAIKRGLEEAASVQPGRMQDRAEVLDMAVVRPANTLLEEVDYIEGLLRRLNAEIEFA